MDRVDLITGLLIAIMIFNIIQLIWFSVDLGIMMARTEDVQRNVANILKDVIYVGKKVNDINSRDLQQQVAKITKVQDDEVRRVIDELLKPMEDKHEQKAEEKPYKIDPRLSEDLEGRFQ